MIPPSASFFTMLKNYNPITEYTMPQLREAFGDFGDEVLDQFKDYYKAKNARNPVEKLGEFYQKLDKQLASISDPGIVSGWISYFKTESQKVRDSAIKKIGSPQFLNRSFPPALNNLTSMDNIYTNNVRPAIIDPNPKVPHMVSTGMDLPGYIMVNLVYAGQVLGEAFNSNVAIAADVAAKNTDPHQGNLAPDEKHPERITAAAPKFIQNALSFFGSAQSFMSKNLGFNKYGIQNKNISSVNYKLNEKTSQNQDIKVMGTGNPYTRDTASLKRFKPQPSV